MNKKKLILGLVAGLVMCPSQVIQAAYVWDKKAVPSNGTTRMLKTGSLATSCGLLGFFLGRCSADKNPLRWITPAIGTVFGAVLGNGWFNGNSPALWKKQFSEVFRDLERNSLLTEGDAWLFGYDLSRDAELLQSKFADLSKTIKRLREVALILVRSGHITSDDVRLSVLERFDVVSSKRHLEVSVLADFKSFHRSYSAFVVSPVVKPVSQGDAWMMSGFSRLSYPTLLDQCARANAQLSSLKDVSKRLLSSAYAPFLTTEDRAEFVQKMNEVAQMGEVLQERSAFVAMRVQFDEFNANYARLSLMGELNAATSVGDAWLNAYSVRTGNRVSLATLQQHFNVLSGQLNSVIASGDSMLQVARVRFLSADERSTIASKILALKDFSNILNERSKMVRGLLLVESFTARFSSVMNSSYVRPSLYGANDTSWMQVAVATQWPLQEVQRLLNVAKFDVNALVRAGLDIANNADVRFLSNGVREDVMAKIAALQNASALVDARLLALCNSTAYAQEVAAKVVHEERQRELARQERERAEQTRRKAERQRADAQLARELDRQEREQQRREQERAERERVRLQQTVRPSAPPMDVPVVRPTPTAPPMDAPAVRPLPSAPASTPAPVVGLQECGICLDDIPVNAAYKLGCSCKTATYHVDCIKKWVNDSKTCPTCRTRVTLADVQRTSSVVAAPSPSVAPAVQSAPVVAPAPVANPAPAQVAVAQAEECYLCLDDIQGGKYTTANCDCTVKKAACKACLDDWIGRNHTCPNCRKSGATVAPMAR
jgi:hypothetical protein